MPKFRIERIDRASLPEAFLHIGQHVYPGRDGYGCANDDTRDTGIEHVSVSLNESGEPFFTIPREDIEPLSPLPSEDSAR